MGGREGARNGGGGKEGRHKRRVGGMKWSEGGSYKGWMEGGREREREGGGGGREGARGWCGGRELGREIGQERAREGR